MAKLKSGCGAVWLARMTGGHEVAGSNPVSPTNENPAKAGFLLFMGSVNMTHHGYIWVKLAIAL